MKSMMSVEKSISAIETASSHSAIPISPVAALCLMMVTFREREIIVAPRRKLVMIVNLKLAASASNLGGSEGFGRTEPTRAIGLIRRNSIQSLGHSSYHSSISGIFAHRFQNSDENQE